MQNNIKNCNKTITTGVNVFFIILKINEGLNRYFLNLKSCENNIYIVTVNGIIKGVIIHININFVIANPKIIPVRIHNINKYNPQVKLRKNIFEKITKQSIEIDGSDAFIFLKTELTYL